MVLHLVLGCRHWLRRIGRNEVMNNCWSCTDMIRIDSIFDNFVRNHNALMLSDMLAPRLDHKCLEVSRWFCQVEEEVPLVGAISSSHPSKYLQLP